MALQHIPREASRFVRRAILSARYKLDPLIAGQSMHWGSDSRYHANVEGRMDREWETIIWPVLERHAFDLRRVMDFACGCGRNTRKLLEAGADFVTMIDVHPTNVAFCAARFKDAPVSAVQCDGRDLAGIPNHSHTAIYSWDAMVHFDPSLIEGYLAEFVRVLRPDGKAFIHHSNYSAAPGGDFRANPGWRNHMPQALFQEMAERAGFAVLGQTVIEWAGVPSLDCISILQA